MDSEALAKVQKQRASEWAEELISNGVVNLSLKTGQKVQIEFSEVMECLACDLDTPVRLVARGDVLAAIQLENMIKAEALSLCLTYAFTHITAEFLAFERGYDKAEDKELAA